MILILSHSLTSLSLPHCLLSFTLSLSRGSRMGVANGIMQLSDRRGRRHRATRQRARSSAPCGLAAGSAACARRLATRSGRPPPARIRRRRLPLSRIWWQRPSPAWIRRAGGLGRWGGGGSGYRDGDGDDGVREEGGGGGCFWVRVLLFWILFFFSFLFLRVGDITTPHTKNQIFVCGCAIRI